jgi:hypothetical protein
MQRRRFLTVCGAGLLAGCLGESGANTPDDAGEPGSPGDTPGEDDTPSDGASDGPAVSVDVETLQPALVALSTPDSIGVYSADRTQYLFLQLAAEGDEAPTRSELEFRFDGNLHDPFEGEDATDLWRLYDEAASRYDAERGEGWICFPLPATGAPEGAGLTWDGGVWGAGPALRDRLAAEAPPLSVSWSAPDTVEAGEAATVELSVTNEGEREGRFVGALNRVGPRVAYTPVTSASRRIPAGGTETWTLDTDELDGTGGWTPEEGPTEATYHLHWPSGHEQRDIEVVPRE